MAAPTPTPKPKPPGMFGAPPPVTVELEIRRKMESQRVGMTLSEHGVVTSVTPGSPASAAGVVPSMRITAANGKAVGNPTQIKAASASSPLHISLTATMHSGGRLRGTVASWSSERGFGTICPDIPLYVAPGVLGEGTPSAVFTGDIFCHSAAILRRHRAASLDPDERQPVEFEVRCVGGRFKAHAVGPIPGRRLIPCEGAASGAPGGARLGSDLAKRYGGKQICMMHFGGKCKAKGCKSLHIANPHLEELEVRKGGKGKEADKGPAPTSVEWVNTNNLGEKHTVVFSRSAGGWMQYTRDGVSRPPFHYMTYCNWCGENSLYLSNQKILHPPSAAVLAKLARLADSCPNVYHNLMDPTKFPKDTLARVGPAKLRILEEQVSAAASKSEWGFFHGEFRVLEAWQLRNDAVEFRFRATEHNMTLADGKAPEIIDGFHGTSESNVLSIAATGFDPLRRAGQVFGAGEYFARNPHVSVGYCGGGRFMFVCKLILGKPNVDHTFVPDMGYYIMKQRDGNVQCLPQYLIRFEEIPKAQHCQLYKALQGFATDSKSGADSLRRLGEAQRGGAKPCKGRVEGCMMSTKTSCLWVGWLDPNSVSSEEDLRIDLAVFLRGHRITQMRIDRNGARYGAFVELASPISQTQLAELNTRPYGERGARISVDDAQPDNAYMRLKRCPKLHGPGRFCRGWNLRGYGNWMDACAFQHAEEASALAGCGVTYERMSRTTAKYASLKADILGMPAEEDSQGRVRAAFRIVNTAQEKAYASRRAFLATKHGNVVEKELWFGTSCAGLQKMLERGITAAADRNASDTCPVSGRKGLQTTLCGADCDHCTDPHECTDCHVFGKGIYLAESPMRAHRDVKPVHGTHSLVKCRVNLGNPYLIESNLKERGSMRNVAWCEDPTPHLQEAPHAWDANSGHDSYYVRGLGGAAKLGLGCRDTEYVVFHPFQVLPLYVVEYSVPEGVTPVTFQRVVAPLAP